MLKAGAQASHITSSICLYLSTSLFFMVCMLNYFLWPIPKPHSSFTCTFDANFRLTWASELDAFFTYSGIQYLCIECLLSTRYMDLVFGGRQDEISSRALGFPCFILSGKPFIYKQLKNKWANLSRWKELIQGHVVAQRILEKAKELGLKATLPGIVPKIASQKCFSGQNCH